MNGLMDWACYKLNQVSDGHFCDGFICDEGPGPLSVITK